MIMREASEDARDINNEGNAVFLKFVRMFGFELENNIFMKNLI